MILICEWAQVEYGGIYNHLILSPACDGKEMKKYKSIDSYDYFKWFRWENSSILHKKGCFKIKQKMVHLSQKLNSGFHNSIYAIYAYSVTWLARFKLVGIHAWRGTVCSHVGALLHRCLQTMLSTPTPSLFSYFYNGF